MPCLFSQLSQIYCLVFIDPRDIPFFIHLELNVYKDNTFSKKEREIKINLLSEYNNADIRLLFRNIIVYIILCENTGQYVNDSNPGNYGFIRKWIAIHQRNILKHKLLLYLIKHIKHIYITTKITAHNVHTIKIMSYYSHFSEHLNINVTCITPTKHFSMVCMAVSVLVSRPHSFITSLVKWILLKCSTL